MILLSISGNRSDSTSSQQVPIASCCPDHLLSTFWIALWVCFATIQSAIFALLSDPDLQAWTLHSPLQFSCSLYAVSQKPLSNSSIGNYLLCSTILTLLATGIIIISEILFWFTSKKRQRETSVNIIVIIGNIMWICNRIKVIKKNNKC